MKIRLGLVCNSSSSDYLIVPSEAFEEEQYNMKIRQKFVSNSSSSSFVIIGDLPKLIPEKIAVEEISGEAAARVLTRARNVYQEQQSWATQCATDSEYLKQEPPPVYSSDLTVHLTQFISDADEIYDEICRQPEVFEYCNGGHGGPYDSDYFTALNEGKDTCSPWDDYGKVWILNEDIDVPNPNEQLELFSDSPYKIKQRFCFDSDDEE